MSEPERQRRLHVENRLAELRSKYGRDIEDQPLPGWLDSLEGYLAAHPAPEQASSGIDVQTDASARPAQNRVLSASEAMRRLDEHGESPLFACLVCGEESAKASTALDYWRCTACGGWGKASAVVRVEALPPTTVQRV